MTRWRTPALHTATALSLRWLDLVLDQLADDHLPLFLQAAAAAALCADITPQAAEPAAQVLESIRGRLQDYDEARFYGASGAAVLLYGVIEQRFYGKLSPALESYADRSAAALKQLPASEVASGYHAAKQLLACVGKYAEPPAEPARLSVDLAVLITADTARVRETVAQVEALTAYGTRAVEFPIGMESLFESIAMIELRRNNLDLASSTLRAMVYLGGGTELGLQTGRHVLLTQQRADGSFGFYDAEERFLTEKTADPLASLKLHLTVTLACLWALAETDKAGYRLYRDVGRLSLATMKV